MVSQRVKSYGALVAVFVLGIAAGAGGMHAFSQRRHAHDIMSGGAPDPRRMEALGRELDLDPAQEDKIRDIFAKHRERRFELQKKMMEQCGEPMEAERKALDSEIRAVLRPEQQKKWDELLERRHRHGPFGGARPHPSAP